MTVNHETFISKAAGRVVVRAASAGKLVKRSAPLLICLAAAAIPMLAQSGDISGSLANVNTLGSTILKCVLGLAGLAFVGLIVWGGLTLSTNRPRGLAMVAGGLVGALLAGLSFVLVNTLTGSTVVTS